MKKAITLSCGSGLLGTSYTHYSTDIITPGEELFTREGNPVEVICCSDENQATSISPMPAYFCIVKGITEGATIYNKEMLDHLNS